MLSWCGYRRRRRHDEASEPHIPGHILGFYTRRYTRTCTRLTWVNYIIVVCRGVFRNGKLRDTLT